VSSELFIPDLSHIVSWFITIFVVALCIIIDTTCWLCFCFPFGAPMLLSGFYEAYLDYIIRRFLEQKMSSRRLTLDMRTRILFVVLRGNLSLESKFRETGYKLISSNMGARIKDLRWPNIHDDRSHNLISHIETLLHPIKTYGNSALLTPQQWPLHDRTCQTPNCTNRAYIEMPRNRDQNFQRHLGRTKTQVCAAPIPPKY
jgi:hypothetical protein